MSSAVAHQQPVQSSTYQPRQQQRRRQRRDCRERKSLIAQLEAGKSDALTAYLDAMARFTTTVSATFFRSPDSAPTQPTLPECTHGTAWTPREKARKAFRSLRP